MHCYFKQMLSIHLVGQEETDFSLNEIYTEIDLFTNSKSFTQVLT